MLVRFLVVELMSNRYSGFKVKSYFLELKYGFGIDVNLLDDIGYESEPEGTKTFNMLFLSSRELFQNY